jgi:hypothetical protein
MKQEVSACTFKGRARRVFMVFVADNRRGRDEDRAGRDDAAGDEQEGEPDGMEAVAKAVVLRDSLGQVGEVADSVLDGLDAIRRMVEDLLPDPGAGDISSLLPEPPDDTRDPPDKGDDILSA